MHHRDSTLVFTKKVNGGEYFSFCRGLCFVLIFVYLYLLVDLRRQFEALPGMNEGGDGDGVETSNGGPFGGSGGGFPGGDTAVGNFVDYWFHFG